MIDFTLSCVKHEKSFITFGPDLGPYCLQYRLLKYKQMRDIDSKQVKITHTF